MPMFRPRSAASILLSLALLVGGACSVAGPSRGPAPEAAGSALRGSIGGVVQHPAHVVPAMRICALSTDPANTRCIEHPAHADRYVIDGLAPGEYLVIAKAHRAGPIGRVGGHVQPVQCVRAPCPEMPATVTLAPGARLDAIDLNGFYDRREDFPALPAAGD